eukprot:TRINITY_DN2848_c0_g1_i1.p1 TRINITY_DN2848_c0_g1~~TRINITY_DN2848_c0_g1_i1.p1  ORF type:complete len:289 (+),score=24.06 TRINITY_DN2848_c0_g1_i1:570-1436(+)
MCWSLKASLAFGVATYAAAGYLAHRNIRWDRANAVTLCLIGSIQFADAVLWWDGMDIAPDGTCSIANWITTALFLPIALRAQLAGRQLELRFSQLTTSCLLLACGAVIGQLAHVVAGTSATWTPAAWFHYVANGRCSTPSQLDFGSPLWASRTIPGYGFFYYMTMVAPPMLASGRMPELIALVATLAVAFTYQETWGSKWCAFGCLLSIWYLAYPGPALPPHARTYQHAPQAHSSNGVNGESDVGAWNKGGGKRLDSDSESEPEPALWAPVRGLVRAYERFSFSTARH